MMRYIVINESVSSHCCFEASVVDTEHENYNDGSFNHLIKSMVCECFDRENAERIADALNEFEATRLALRSED